MEELISLKNLDAVIISTTHHLHSQIISECVNKNIHVFVEKPGGISAKETYKIILKLKNKKSNLIIRAGFNHRYHPAFLKAKELIDNKIIGKILFIRAVYGHGGRLGYEKKSGNLKKNSQGVENL